MGIKPTNTENFIDAAGSVTKAISRLSIKELCELRNKLIPTELTIVNEDNECDIYLLSDIEAWGRSVDITYTESDDLPEYPINYWLDGEASDISFASKSDALRHAFEKNVRWL